MTKPVQCAKRVPLREIVSNFMCLAISTRADISSAVRSLVRYSYYTKSIYWKAAQSILAYIDSNSNIGITSQRGTYTGISSEIFTDAGELI